MRRKLKCGCKYDDPPTRLFGAGWVPCKKHERESLAKAKKDGKKQEAEEGEAFERGSRAGCGECRGEESAEQEEGEQTEIGSEVEVHRGR